MVCQTVKIGTECIFMKKNGCSYNGGITSPTVIGTACLLHEDTFCSHFDGLTNHGDLPPFSLSLLIQIN